MDARRFIKTIPMKLYLILLAVILFAFFSNDFGLVDVQKTAVILAAGIDKTEDGYMLSSQIAVPKGSDRTTGGTSSVEIETEGKTVSDCVSMLYAKTGWVPKLVFCNLILLGEEAAKDDVFGGLNYFMRNEYMPDSCYLAVCEGKAGEMLSTQSAIDDASSLAITKLFSDASVKSGKVMPNTLKDFSISYFGVSKSGYLPYLRMADQEGSQEAGGNESPGGSGKQSETQKIYSANETALFHEGKMVGLLSPEETFAFSLLKGEVFTGTFNAMDGEKPVTLTVLENGGGVSLETKESPKVKLSLSLTVRLCCRGMSAPIDDVSSDEVSDETLRSAEETLKGYIGTLWDECVTSGCDLFELKRDLYRSSLKKYSELKDAVPGKAETEIEAKVETKS